MLHWRLYYFMIQFMQYSSVFVIPMCTDVIMSAQAYTYDWSVTFLWVTCSSEETPVGQASTTHTAQWGHFMKLSGSMNQPGLHESKENIYHNQTFSFSGRTENTTSHCGYLRSLKISYKDNSLCIRWQAVLFSLSLVHQNCRSFPMSRPIMVCI